MKCPLKDMHAIGRPIQWYEKMSIDIDKYLKAAKEHKNIEINLDSVIWLKHHYETED